MATPKLLPHPRHLRLTGQVVRLPSCVGVEHNDSLPAAELRLLANRLNTATDALHISLNQDRGSQPAQAQIRLNLLASTPVDSPEAHELAISPPGIRLGYHTLAGLRAGVATLCQLLRQYGRRLPCLTIRDWPDFERRGVMLDISRGRVPNLNTLKQLATDLAGFKINELQLYIEHTFAYGGHRKVWRGGGALTATEMRRLDAHCRALGIDLVPNQNSFGHLRYWLEHEEYTPLAEVEAPYPAADGTFLRFPTTLAPNHRGTIPFLRSLYDELLPNFSSSCFNVGCDETWDLGRGQSKSLCKRKGQGQVYLDFLLKVHREVRKRGRTMMFWGDIILKHPELIPDLPGDVIALNWGYEADHPFGRESHAFAQAGIPFYVCPGTSTWQTLIGRNDNAFSNLETAARAGKRNGAIGYLITDWGDGGHPQPLAVSYPMYLTGAALAWCGRTFAERDLVPVLSRDVFRDHTRKAATALMRLGLAHKRFHYTEPNATPFGAPIAAPPSEQRELFCRHGLKYFARLSARNIRSAQSAVAKERLLLQKSNPTAASGRILIEELELAARMAEESCRYLLWQQALAGGRLADARSLATTGVENLKCIKRDFADYWPTRNKGPASNCAAFLDWRIEDYTTNCLHYSPAQACLSP